MPSTTFFGEVQSGRVQTERLLTEFEGRKVSVTVLEPEAPVPGATGEANENPPQEMVGGPEEPVILEDLGRIDIPARNVIPLKARFIDVGRLPPRIYSSDEED